MSQELKSSTNESSTNDQNQDSYYWTLERRREFMKLPKAERQALLLEQAEQVAKYYKGNQEIENLGGGDFANY